MKKIENKELFVGIIFIMVVLLFGFIHFFKIKKEGIITIAKVTSYETEVGLCIDVFFTGKVFKTFINQGSSSCIGNYYFVKILKDDPSSVLIFDKIIVSDCILKKPLPPNGWMEIPKDTCK